MSTKRRVDGPEDVGNPANLVEILPLGAGSEVGRSCIILKYQ